MALDKTAGGDLRQDHHTTLTASGANIHGCPRSGGAAALRHLAVTLRRLFVGGRGSGHGCRRVLELHFSTLGVACPGCCVGRFSLCFSKSLSQQSSSFARVTPEAQNLQRSHPPLEGTTAAHHRWDTRTGLQEDPVQPLTPRPGLWTTGLLHFP